MQDKVFCDQRTVYVQKELLVNGQKPVMSSDVFKVENGEYVTEREPPNTYDCSATPALRTVTTSVGSVGVAVMLPEKESTARAPTWRRS
jgi:hypothetical protein